MDSDVIKTICHCIEILVGDNKCDVLLAPHATETDAFLAHLRNNIDLVLSELKACPKLQELLKNYEKYTIQENEGHTHWNFVTWCLILITVLHDSLQSKPSDTKKKTVADAATATSALSIAQQKAVEKCLQFIIALGFLPNLLPGLGISLRNRIQYAGILEHVGKDVCPRTKYKYLITSLTVLLRCTSHILLQSIIITRHAGDLLVALFQICYAPIKKLKDHEFCGTSKDGRLHSRCDQIVDVGLTKKLFDLPKNLIDMLGEAKDSTVWTENQLVSEMWEDRQNFLPHLEQLLQKICPQVLIWELFLLQGMHHRSVKEKQTKTPLWLKKLCHQMLTDQLFRPQGVKLFVHVMLDKVTDTDLKEGAVDKTKVEAVARLISSKPFHNGPLEGYIKKISAQIIDLLHSKDRQMGYLFACVASSIVLQLAEMDQSISEKYIFKRIFKEFVSCLDKAEISRCEEGACLIKEDELTACIEDAYQIFVQNGVPSHHNAFDLLLPFYHLLFIMFAQTQNGVSFLFPKLKGLLVSLLKSYSANDALMLLRLASFEDVPFQPVQYATGFKCALGDSGGIVLIKNSKLSPEELLEDINKKCMAVTTIIDEISNKKLRVSHFLYLLKRLTDLSVSSDAASGYEEDKDFKNSLILLQQLQVIAETIGEDLVEDIVEATHFIKLALEKAVAAQSSEQCEQLLFGPETVMMSLVILSTITEYKNQVCEETGNVCVHDDQHLCEFFGTELLNLPRRCPAVEHSSRIAADSFKGGAAHHAVQNLTVSVTGGMQCPPLFCLFADLVIEMPRGGELNLSSSHWKAMKECLPSLEKLAASSKDVILKSMCENLVYALATHGATANMKRAEELPSGNKSKFTSVTSSKTVLNTKESTTCEILNPVSQGKEHEAGTGINLCEHPHELLNCESNESVMAMRTSQVSLDADDSGQLRTKDSVSSQQDDSSELNHPSKILSGLPCDNIFCSDASNKDSPYKTALEDVNDSILPVRGHGLITLTKLIRENNKEALAHKEDLLKIFMENLSDEDSYIYLASIQGLSALADVSTELVLPAVLKRFSGTNDKCEVQLKLGEVLMKICRNLGEVTVRYRSEFIHAYLCGARHSSPEIRASSLSNLGEVCKHLRFSLEPFLQEILLCVLSLLKTDPDVEVCCSAVLVITLLLQGTGKHAFMVLESEMKELYRVLRHVHYCGKDVLALHAQLALEEINAIVKEVFCYKPTLTKEIHIADPF